jgi:hypothetical protein
MTPLIELTGGKGSGPFRTRRPVYVDLLPPCNQACPAGENIQAWLGLAQSGRYRETWEALVCDNRMPAVHGHVCYHPCESACNRVQLDAAVDQGVSMVGWRVSYRSTVRLSNRTSLDSATLVGSPPLQASGLL